MAWLDRNAGWLGIVLALLCLVTWTLFLTGCGTDTRSDVRVEKRVVTVTREVRQEIAPDGSIVKLESVIRTVTDENGQQIGSEEVSVRPPEIIGQIANLAKPFISAAATAVAGPAGGQAAQAGMDMISMLIGSSAAALPAGAGYMALRKKKSEVEAMKDEINTLSRQRDEIVDGIERGTADMPDEHWEKLRSALEAEQSADTKRAVKARVG